MDGAALRFYDFVHDYCRCLRARAGGRRTASSRRRGTRRARPSWAGAPAQMPCCGALAPAAVLPVEGERPWHDVGAHAVAAALAARAADIVAEAARALAGGLELASLEGHGVELMGGPTGAALGPGAAPWRELLLFDSAGGWREEPCARFPTVCDILRDAPQVVGAPTAVAVDGAGFCCRAHLGLATPPAGAASLTVAGETRTFDDGTVLCFDDSFWHEARNDDGAAPRDVLSVDSWKEGLAAR
ncbi:peptide-aspartate beta-dioxygenase [Aureococcus anophagefferens]|nr:peptide-aspartate beta-dioxygenase [Aureococcus anophagefferens]